MPEGFARIAAVSLPVHLGDVEANEREVMLALERLRTQGVQAAVFPELCLTGYTLGDLLLHGLVQDRAWAALKRLKAHTDGLTAVVGLPFCHEGRLYNCAAVLANGEIWALVPTDLPNGNGFLTNPLVCQWSGRARNRIARRPHIPSERGYAV